MLEDALSAGRGVVDAVAPEATPAPLAPTTDAHGRPAGAHTPEQNGLTEAAFNTALQKLMAATGGKVSINSGKRDSKRQKELWENALKKYGSEAAARKWVAPPAGTRLSDGSIAKGSRHETGLASDLKFADDATKALVHKIAAEYGLYFPMDWEPWHVELRGTRG